MYKKITQKLNLLESCKPVETLFFKKKRADSFWFELMTLLIDDFY